MSKVDEKQAFSARLKLALKRSRKKIETASELALQFNLRHPNQSISQQAAHKWLTGQARPTLDKIETLAKWLNVPIVWLRYGVSSETHGYAVSEPLQNTAQELAPLSEDELKLLMYLRNMPGHRRSLIMEIAEQFFIDGNIWPSM
ncbi:transcriptional regulator [Pollutimonas sp. H1-120]|uniref:helix-turn-helix domain-containing protein n=1 Tax=Pollutimonas sp. H1-120 TaxID=3148824 RepID=UPI003B519B90